MSKKYPLDTDEQDALPQKFQEKRVRRRTGSQVPFGNQDFLSFRRDGMEAEGPSLLELNVRAPDTGRMPDDDIDQVPFSVFFEYQSQREKLRETFWDELRRCNYLGFMNVQAAGGYGSLFAMTRFGAIYAGQLTMDADLVYDIVLYAPAINTGRWPGYTVNVEAALDLDAHPEIAVEVGPWDGVPAVADWMAWEKSVVDKYYLSNEDTRDFAGKYLTATYNVGGWAVVPGFSYATLAGGDQAFEMAISDVQRMVQNRGTKNSSALSRMFDGLTPEKMLTEMESEERAYAEQDASAWSEKNWPEFMGLKTAYIDNVGVFIPDYMDIDFNLSHALGDKLVGLTFMRAPDLAMESKMREMREWSAFISFITGGSGQPGGGSMPAQEGSGINQQLTGGTGGFGGAGVGIAQGIQNTIGYARGIIQRQWSYKRVAYPRLRAFGRESRGAIVPYEEYYRRCNAMGAPEALDASATGRGTLYYNKYGNLYVFRLPRAAYDEWVAALRPYITNNKSWGVDPFR